MKLSRLLCSIALTLGATAVASAADGFTAAKSDAGATVTYNGKHVADYVIGGEGNKTYLWPIHSASGKSMTRSFPMKNVEGEKQDHYHHRGLNFGHESMGGFDTWTEAGTFKKEGGKPNPASQKRLDEIGTIKHREFKELSADKNKAVITSVCDFLDPHGKKALTEVRTMTFRVDGTSRIIDVDQDFTASEGDVEFKDMKDAGLSIRVPHSMAVDTKQGGKIVNSEGQTDAGAWSKKATWVDYHGPVEGEHLGIAVLNHPSSFRAPTSWHVRTYGLFTANPWMKEAGNAPHTLKKGETLKLRHRFIFHSGDEKAGKIAEAYAKYAAEKK